jgi:hypothetical protein
MIRNARLGIVVGLIGILLVSATVASAAGRTIDRAEVYLGGDGTKYKSDASLVFSYMELYAKKGALDLLGYQISVMKDARVVVKDVEYVGAQGGVMKVLWKQSAEDAMNFILDNFDPDKNAQKVVSKRKFFTAEVPFDFETGIVRFVVDLKGKPYNVDWTMKTNEIKAAETK